MDTRLHMLARAGLGALALLALGGCEPDAVDEPVDPLGQDPLLARALHDPLMIDPDLVGRSNAYALFVLRDGHPLPVFTASSEAASRARDAARRELLEQGPIPDLAAPSPEASGFHLGQAAHAGAMVDNATGRRDCSDALVSDLNWSTRLPPASALPPHAMVHQAAGVDRPGCVIRVVRYRTPMGPEQALEYHYTKLERAGFQITRFGPANPLGEESQLVAQRQGEKVVVAVRSGPNEMTAVDLIDTRL